MQGHREFPFGLGWNKEDVLRGGSVRGHLSNPDGGGRLLIQRNGDRSLPVSLDMWDGWKAVGDTDIRVDFKT